MAFTSANQPKVRKPRGPGKKSLPKDICDQAMKNLREALQAGEPWATESVLKRWLPPLRPITPESSLDGEMLKAKIAEITEFEKRLEALERMEA